MFLPVLAMLLKKSNECVVLLSLPGRLTSLLQNRQEVLLGMVNSCLDRPLKHASVHMKFMNGLCFDMFHNLEKVPSVKLDCLAESLLFLFCPVVFLVWVGFLLVLPSRDILVILVACCEDDVCVWEVGVLHNALS